MIDEEQLAHRLRDEVAGVPVPRSVTTMTPPRRRTTRGRVILAVAVAAVAASVAADFFGASLWPGGQQHEAAASASQPWASESDQMLIRCGSRGSPFRPALVDEGGLDLSRDDRADVESALDRLRDDAGMDAPKALQQTSGQIPWVVVAHDGGEGPSFTVLLPERAGGTVRLDTADVVELKRSGTSLRAHTWGGRCGAEPALDEQQTWANVQWSGAPERSVTTVHLKVTETQCSGGRDPKGHLGQPFLVETDKSVTVYWSADAVPGGGLCAGNPSVERTLRLAEPLGDRELLDGSMYPPRRVR